MKNSCFFNENYNYLLGFGVYHVNEKNKIKCINFDIISHDLETDAYAAIRGFEILQNQEFFKEVFKNDWIIWADCGTHFRNNDLVSYLLKHLLSKHIYGKY